MSLALRSGIFCSAILRICVIVTLPTVPPRPVVVEPFSIPAAFNRKKLAGGVFVTKLNERSEKHVITTGIGIPGSSDCVAALNCLQNSMMLRPRGPSAVPTGGDGL